MIYEFFNILGIMSGTSLDGVDLSINSTNGMTLERLGQNSFKKFNNKVIFKLVRDQDLFAWKFAKKGFFKFKENIPKINQYIFQK